MQKGTAHCSLRSEGVTSALLHACCVNVCGREARAGRIQPGRTAVRIRGGVFVRITTRIQCNQQSVEVGPDADWSVKALLALLVRPGVRWAAMRAGTICSVAAGGRGGSRRLLPSLPRFCFVFLFLLWPLAWQTCSSRRRFGTRASLAAEGSF